MRSSVSRRKNNHKKITALLIVSAVFVLVIIFIVMATTKVNNSSDKISKTETKADVSIKSNPNAPIVAVNEKPNYKLPPIVNGLAPVVTSIPTEDKVVFLGIDDGAFQDESVLQIMKDNNINASLFLAKSFISNNPKVFQDLVSLGYNVENHTLSHNTVMVSTMSYDQQKAEICGMSDYIEKTYGRRPVLFRPPGGSYSETMRKVVADCGMKAIINWIAKANGGSMQYQIGNALRPGDVVLMHFRPEFKQDMEAFVAALSTAGLTTAPLPETSE